ncbi:hypothetical protein SprV_0100175500 [Sparganum proliferum]
MTRNKVEVTAVSETRFSEQGHLEQAERRDTGVAFVILNAIVERLPCPPQVMNDRLMTLRLSLRDANFACRQYLRFPNNQPRRGVEQVPRRLPRPPGEPAEEGEANSNLGYFNVQTGTDLAAPMGVLGAHGEATWVLTRPRRLQLLDNILLRLRGRYDMLLTKAICGVDGWTDHRFANPKMKLRIPPHRRPQDQRPPGKLDAVVLNVFVHRFDFSSQLTHCQEKLQTPNGNVTMEMQWYQLRSVVHSTALEFIGRPCCQQQTCFNGKHKIATAEMQNAWIGRQAEKIRGYADLYETKKFNAFSKAVYGLCTRRTPPLLSSDGRTLHTEKSQMPKCWPGLFKSGGLSPSELSSAANPQFLTPPPTGSSKWKPFRTLTIRRSLRKQSKLCNISPAGKHQGPTQSRRNPKSTAALG